MHGVGLCTTTGRFGGCGAQPLHRLGSRTRQIGRVRTRPDAKKGVAAGRVRPSVRFRPRRWRNLPRRDQQLWTCGLVEPDASGRVRTHQMDASGRTKSESARAFAPPREPRCVPLHHRTTRRLWCEAFAPFRKPDAPHRTRPGASGRVRRHKMDTKFIIQIRIFK